MVSHLPSILVLDRMALLGAAMLLWIAPERMLWESDWPHATEQEMPDEAGVFDLIGSGAPHVATRDRVLVHNFIVRGRVTDADGCGGEMAGPGLTTTLPAAPPTTAAGAMLDRVVSVVAIAAIVRGLFRSKR